MPSSSETQLTKLLKKAGRAHHEFQRRQLAGIRNEDWPVWYADFLLARGLPDLLGTSLSSEQLAQILVALDQSYRELSEQDQQALDWPTYYASKLIEHFITGDHA